MAKNSTPEKPVQSKEKKVIGSAAHDGLETPKKTTVEGPVIVKVVTPEAPFEPPKQPS